MPRNYISQVENESKIAAVLIIIQKRLSFLDNKTLGPGTDGINAESVIRNPVRFVVVESDSSTLEYLCGFCFEDLKIL